MVFVQTVRGITSYNVYLSVVL